MQHLSPETTRSAIDACYAAAFALEMRDPEGAIAGLDRAIGLIRPAFDAPRAVAHPARVGMWLTMDASRRLWCGPFGRDREAMIAAISRNILASIMDAIDGETILVPATPEMVGLVNELYPRAV